MNHHPRERRSFVEAPAGFSRRLDDLIERLIDMRDALDGDPDFEPDADDEDGADEEPDLGAPEVIQTWDMRFAWARGIDGEVTTPTTWQNLSQGFVSRAACAEDELEDGHDAEHDTSDSETTLGWSEAESLSGDLHAGSPFGEDEDGDEDADIADMPHDDEGDAEPSAGGTWEA